MVELQCNRCGAIEQDADVRVSRVGHNSADVFYCSCDAVGVHVKKGKNQPGWKAPAGLYGCVDNRPIETLIHSGSMYAAMLDS